MPTYKNNTTSIKQIKNTAGNIVNINPGESIQSYEIRTDLTQTEATPYYNPLVARHTISSAGEGDDQIVSITVASTVYIKVWKVTGGPVSIFFAAKANTPSIAILRAGDSFVCEVNGNVGQIVMAFSAAGTCELIEAKENLS